MKICYLMAGLGHTGGCVVLYNFMEQLTRRGHEVYAVTPQGRVRWQVGMCEDACRGRASRLPIEYSAPERLLRNLWRKLAIRSGVPKPLVRVSYLTQRLLHNWTESDVTIGTYYLTAYAAYALMDRTVPLVHMQHMEELFFEDPWERKLARLNHFLPLELIANSSWLKAQILERAGIDAHLLKPAVSHAVFAPRHGLNEKYSGGGKTTVVSYADRRRFKGWQDAAEAMRLVFRELGTQGVEWVTFGSYEPPPVEGAPVRHVGLRFGTDLVDLYSSAHVVFCSSWYESFPLPPLEAMCCGSAVVTTRFGTEDYAFDGENSLVVPPRDPQRMAEAIVSLAKHPDRARQLATAGLETARGITWERSADTLERILGTSVKDYRWAGKYDDIRCLIQGEIPV